MNKFYIEALKIMLHKFIFAKWSNDDNVSAIQLATSTCVGLSPDTLILFKKEDGTELYKYNEKTQQESTGKIELSDSNSQEGFDDLYKLFIENIFFSPHVLHVIVDDLDGDGSSAFSAVIENNWVVEEDKEFSKLFH